MKHYKTLLILLPLLFFLCSIIKRFLTEKKTVETNKIFLIDIISQNSRLNNLSPGIKLFLTTVYFCLSFINTGTPVYLLLILGLAYISISLGGVSCRNYLKLFLVPFWFLLFALLPLLFKISSIPQEPVLLSFEIGKLYLSVTRESLKLSIQVSGRALAAFSALFFLVLNTPIYKILDRLEKLHFPQLLIELIFLVYRFIFVLWQIAQDLILAANLRMGFGSLRQTIKSVGYIGAGLFILSFKKVNDYFNALESRLYSGKLRFLEKTEKVNRVMLLKVSGLTVYLVFIAVIFR